MSTSAIAGGTDRWLRLQRARGRAEERHLRRYVRSRLIERKYRGWRGRMPGPYTKPVYIYDDFLGYGRKWSYERSLHLEDQAYMLLQRLTLLRNAPPAVEPV